MTNTITVTQSNSVKRVLASVEQNLAVVESIATTAAATAAAAAQTAAQTYADHAVAAQATTDAGVYAPLAQAVPTGGSDGQVVGHVAGAPAWVTASGATVTDLGDGGHQVTFG